MLDLGDKHELHPVALRCTEFQTELPSKLLPEWWMVHDGTGVPNSPLDPTKDILRKRITFHSATGCRLHQGAKDRFGYGRVFLAGKERKAPKLYFEVFVDPVPSGARLIHALAPKNCLGSGCCNPAHLQIELTFQNVRFARRICPKGHLIDADNSIIEQRSDTSSCAAECAGAQPGDPRNAVRG